MAFNGENERAKLQVETQYLNEDNIDSMFNFGKDEMLDINSIEENDMFKPTLITYYNEEVQNW